MAEKESIFSITLDTGGLEGSAREVQGALRGLGRTLTRIANAITGAFAFTQAAEYLDAAAKAGGRLDKQLLVLRLAFGKLRAAIGRAIAPLGEIFLPLLSRAAYAATAVVNAIGRILNALLGGSGGFDTLSDSAQTAESAVRSAAGSIRRSLAGFDQLERLDAPTGSGGSAGEAAVSGTLGALTLMERLLVSKIETLLKPLKAIDLTPAIKAFDRLKEAIAPITKELFAGLEWAWYNLLTPLARWTAEEALPVFLDGVSAALTALGSVIEAVKPYAQWLWEELLLPLAQWTGGKILEILEGLTQKLKGVSQWIGENQSAVRAMTAVAAAFLAVWAGNQVAAWLTEAEGLTGFFGTLLQGVLAVVAAVGLLGTDFGGLPGLANRALSGIRQVLQGVPQWLREKVLALLPQQFKDTANKGIRVVNGLLQVVASGLNFIIKSINSLSFTVPKWVPVVGGQSIGYSLKSVTPPQIPYLAKGAVLPANKPFLAVVGDQRHGTNIEAPLATIQEAVAVVMEDMVKSNMAGHEATVSVLQEILAAVLGIEIGDDVIGQAAARYDRKMAMVRGGY